MNVDGFMIYIDTSSLLKTLWEEPESPAVLDGIAGETNVVVSSLTRLECEVQLRGRRLGGALSKKRYEGYRQALTDYVQHGPFEYQNLSGSVFRDALRKLEDGPDVHCRSLDRLHLAAMEELGIRRLMTNDAKQADVARALGFEVLVPGGGE